MKIAVCTDELHPVNEYAVEVLKELGHEVVAFGSLISKKDEPWASVAEEAAQSVAKGDCDQGVFFCWTGTGISMAANKVPGIRAALCTDVETVRGARAWNDANVLALSNRLVPKELARKMIEAWFEKPKDEPSAASGIAQMKELDSRYRS